MAEAEKETERKPRTVEPKKWTVQALVGESKTTWMDAADCTDTASGHDWIAANGEDGKTYRVAACSRSVTVKDEVVKTRKLV